MLHTPFALELLCSEGGSLSSCGNFEVILDKVGQRSTLSPKP